MENNQVCDYLNKLIDRAFRYYGVNYSMPMRFMEGDRLVNLTNLLKEIAPSSKGVYLTFGNEFKFQGKPTLQAVENAGCKLINLVMPEDIEDSIETIADLFNLPEDTRFAVYSDTRLNVIASYFASVKQIPLIFIPKSLCTNGFACSEIKIKDGRHLDTVRLAVERYILIDFAYIKNREAYLAYAHLMSGLCNLVEYRINGVISNKPMDKFSYDLMRDAVIKTFGIVSVKPEQRGAELLYQSFVKDLADGFIKNAYTFVSSAKEGYRLIKDYKKNEVYYCLDMSLKVMELLNVYLNKGEVYRIPDYNERSELLTKITGIDQTYFLKNFMYQRVLLKKKDGTLERVATVLKDEVESFANKRKKIMNTFLALGGKESPFVKSKEYVTALKYAGDTPDRINAMSLLREAGITELIDEENF